MTRGEARTNHLAVLLVGGSGLIWAWMRYLYEAPVDPDDEFGLMALVAHPQEPLIQALHVVTAPLLVFAVGLLWRDHVWKRVKNGFPLRRQTGLLLFALVAPMTLSGYLLQVSVDESARSFWQWTHVATSVLWTAGYLIHQLRPRRARGATSSRGA